MQRSDALALVSLRPSWLVATLYGMEGVIAGVFFKMGRNQEMEGGAYRGVKPFKGTQEWPKPF